MRSVFISTLACLALWPVASTASVLDTLDAFLMAVQHFDPEHRTGIEFAGREVKFTEECLRAARQAVPKVADIHVRSDWDRYRPMSPLMFKTLELKGGEPAWRISAATVDRMRAVGTAIGADCETSIQTDEKRSRGRRLSTQTRTRWDLDRACRQESYARRCANTEVVDWLCTWGVAAVLVSESVYENGRQMAAMYLMFQAPVDLDYMASALMNDARYPEVFGDLRAEPYLGDLVGDGPSLDVVPCESLSGFEGMCFRFSVGWGDCESGCIAWHHWIVRCTARDSVPGEDGAIIAELIEEGGSVFPGSLETKERRAIPSR